MKKKPSNKRQAVIPSSPKKRFLLCELCCIYMYSDRIEFGSPSISIYNSGLEVLIKSTEKKVYGLLLFFFFYIMGWESSNERPTLLGSLRKIQRIASQRPCEYKGQRKLFSRKRHLSHMRQQSIEKKRF